MMKSTVVGVNQPLGYDEDVPTAPSKTFVPRLAFGGSLPSWDRAREKILVDGCGLHVFATILAHKKRVSHYGEKRGKCPFSQGLHITYIDNACTMLFLQIVADHLFSSFKKP